MLPWTHPSPRPKQHLDWFCGFCRAHDRDIQTDRQTEHAILLVTKGCIYVRNTVMRPNNNNNNEHISLVQDITSSDAVPVHDTVSAFVITAASMKQTWK